MKTLRDLYNNASLWENTSLMPMLFVGHGSPMNAIENNEFTEEWQYLSRFLPKPRAIVCISAHWESRGTFVTMSESPKTIHDFYGFPRELYDEKYPASGFPALAEDIITHLQGVNDIQRDHQWGLDHGVWTILKYIYPEADIPVIQLSIDHYKDPQWHYNLGKELAFLRRKGVLVVGSGNMIHNLGMLRFSGSDFNAEHGYDWAFEINEAMKKSIISGDYNSLVNYRSVHKDISLAVPTLEHYIPMLYILGIKNENDRIMIFNDKVIAGSLSMTSFIVG